MNRYPLWKYLLLLFVLSIGLIYALPNLYKEDPAVRISGADAQYKTNTAVMQRVENLLQKEGIPYFGVEQDGKVGLLRFANRDDQEEAREKIQDELRVDRYIAAFYRATTTPDWLENLGAKPMTKGLDLAGGVHFLLEVDTSEILDAEVDKVRENLRTAIIKDKLYGVSVRRAGDGIEVNIPEEHKSKARALLRKDAASMSLVERDEDGQLKITGTLLDSFIREQERYAVQQNLTTIRKRVNAIGASEPLVQTQGRNRIVVQLPGIQDTTRARKIIGKTANLEFRLAAQPDTTSSQKQSFRWKNPDYQNERGSKELLKRAFVTGEHVTKALPSSDAETGLPVVSITLDGEGGNKMHEATWTEVGRSMGILLIEDESKVEDVFNEAGEKVGTKINKVSRHRLISFANIKEALGHMFQITGLNQGEARDLALLIRSGSLAAPMVFVEERTIGPSLGDENIKLGMKSVQLGLALVLVFMLVYYKVFGIFANLALTVNMIVLVALMSILGATLTLPGIAGIVLTVGMAVDANVLIFSRIKEEIRAGSPPQKAINDGYDNAYSTILDANLTTLIVAVILFGIGSGPVKGFAVTLMFGIGTSMFTAIMGTRALANLVFGGRKLEKLWI